MAQPGQHSFFKDSSQAARVRHARQPDYEVVAQAVVHAPLRADRPHRQPCPLGELLGNQPRGEISRDVELNRCITTPAEQTPQFLGHRLSMGTPARSGLGLTKEERRVCGGRQR